MLAKLARIGALLWGRKMTNENKTVAQLMEGVEADAYEHIFTPNGTSALSYFKKNSPLSNKPTGIFRKILNQETIERVFGPVLAERNATIAQLEELTDRSGEHISDLAHRLGNANKRISAQAATLFEQDRELIDLRKLRERNEEHIAALNALLVVHRRSQSMTLDLHALARLADGATQGRWMRLFGERTVYALMSDGCRGNAIVRSDITPPSLKEAANLDFIAACSPETIHELLCMALSRSAPDKGPWSADIEGENVFLQSENFEHDVRLYVNGDFYSLTEKLEYAHGVAATLNAAAAPTPPAGEK